MELDYYITIDTKKCKIDIGKGRLFLNFAAGDAQRFTLAFIAMVANHMKRKKTHRVSLHDVRDRADLLRLHLNPALKKLENMYVTWKQRLRLSSEGRQYTVHLKEQPEVEIFHRRGSRTILAYDVTLPKILADTMTKEEHDQFNECLYLPSNSDKEFAFTKILDPIYDRLFSTEKNFIEKLFSTEPGTSRINPAFCINLTPKKIIIKGLPELIKKAKKEIDKIPSECAGKGGEESLKITQMNTDLRLYVGRNVIPNQKLGSYAMGIILKLTTFRKKMILMKGTLILDWFQDNSETLTSPIGKMEIIGLAQANSTGKINIWRTFPLSMEENSEVNVRFWFIISSNIAKALLRKPKPNLYGYFKLEGHRGEKFGYSLYPTPQVFNYSGR